MNISSLKIEKNSHHHRRDEAVTRPNKAVMSNPNKVGHNKTANPHDKATAPSIIKQPHPIMEPHNIINKKNKKNTKVVKELDFQFIIMKEINKKIKSEKEINIFSPKKTKNETTPAPVNIIAPTSFLSKAQGEEFTNIIFAKQFSQNKNTKPTNKGKSQTYPLNDKNERNERNENSSLKSSIFKNEIKLPAHKKKSNEHINNSLKEKLNFKENLNLLSNKNNFTQKAINKSINQTQTNNYKTMKSIKTQLQDSITYMSQNNRKQVVLKLTPEHLGKLEINISMIKKSTKVEIKVQKHETLELLNNNQTSLKNLFSEIKKASNDISFSFDKNTNSESESNNSKQKRKKYQEIEEKFNYSENETISSYVGLIEVIV